VIRKLAAATALLASACAPVVQEAGKPHASFAGPRLMTDAFVSFDGTQLALTRWEPEREPWAVIVAVHGFNDYANAFRFAGPYWAERGAATYAYDQRGYGRSPRRGVWGGAELMAEDLRTLTALVRRKHPDAVVAVVGESMGGSVAVEAFASDRPPAAERLVLLAPGVWGWAAQPPHYAAALWIGARVAPGRVLAPPRFITRHVKPTDNREEMERMGRDRLMIWGSRIDAMYGVTGLMHRAWAKMGRLEVPTAYFYGYNDKIIPKRPTFQAAALLKPTDRTAYYRGGWHLLVRDRQRERVMADVLAFIRDPAAPWPSGAPPLPVRGRVAGARAGE
jgi:alpha-beta hydrolase superfamily lysophospholipase